MLSVTKAQKRLGARDVLCGVDLASGPGAITTVTGPNGSGKSTLLRAICGVIELDAGEVVIGGHSLRRAPTRAKAELGYAPDGLEALPDLRAGELMSLVRGLRSLTAPPHGDEREWRERLGFDELATRRVLSLSLGQRKRVALVLALSGSPPLLLLDEPSAGLDPSAVDTLVDLIETGRRGGRCHLITTNDAELVARLGGTRLHFDSGRLVKLAT